MCLTRVLYYREEKDCTCARGWKVVKKHSVLGWLTCGTGEDINCGKWLTAKRNGMFPKDEPPCNVGFHVFALRHDAEVLKAFLEQDGCEYRVVEVEYRDIVSIGLGDGYVNVDAAVLVVGQVRYLPFSEHE